METHFGPEFFVGNRNKLRKLFTGTAPIVLTANGQLQRAASEPYTFTQDASFWYLTGVRSADILLVIDKNNEYLILPQRSEVHDIFDGQQQGSELSELSGISEVLNYKEGMKRLGSRLKRTRHLATLAPSPEYVEVYGMYTNPARANLLTRLQTINPNLKVLDLRLHLTKLRMAKQSQELAAISKAVNITTKTLKHLENRGFNHFVTGFDIDTELTRLFRENGADGTAFDSVVAAGDETCVIHSRPSKRLLPKRGPLILDVGAAVDGYCADISRTYFLTAPTKRQQQVYQAVFEVQNYALSLIKPGLVIRAYEAEIEKYMGEKLRELGLIKTISHQSVRHYFPHATSHHLGIDVHDAADYDAPLLENMVITVEPGIYIPEEKLGIRIEDDVLVTKSSNKLLSVSLSRELRSPTIS